MDVPLALEVAACVVLAVAGLVGVVRARRKLTPGGSEALVKASKAGATAGGVLIASVIFLSVLQLTMASHAMTQVGEKGRMPPISLSAVLETTVIACGGFALVGWSLAARRGAHLDLMLALVLAILALLFYAVTGMIEIAHLVALVSTGRPGLLPGSLDLLIRLLAIGCSGYAVLSLVRAVAASGRESGLNMNSNSR